MLVVQALVSNVPAAQSVQHTVPGATVSQLQTEVPAVYPQSPEQHPVLKKGL